MRFFYSFKMLVLAFAIAAFWGSQAHSAALPDGRLLTPIGFTIPVEGFASSEALSPDGTLLAVLSQDGGAVDIIRLGEDSRLVDRLSTPFATAITCTSDWL